MVFIKKVLNADAGDADHVGGNDWDVLDDYFDGVATGKTAIINSITRFLGQNLRVRNPLNTFSYVHLGGAITGTRIVSYPVLAGDANFVFDSHDNTFTTGQTITRSSAVEFLTLYKANQTNGTNWDINFEANNSSGAQVNYAEIRSTIADNTAGAVDGRLLLRTQINSIGTDIMSIDGTEIKHNKPVKNESYVDMKAVSDASVTSPSSGYVRLFLSSTDGHLKYKRSNGDLVVVD